MPKPKPKPPWDRIVLGLDPALDRDATVYWFNDELRPAPSIHAQPTGTYITETGIDDTAKISSAKMQALLEQMQRKMVHKALAYLVAPGVYAPNTNSTKAKVGAINMPNTTKENVRNAPCVVFSNPGAVDPRLLVTFGANVKENAEAIGFFGTGFKYAMAILMRHNHLVTVYSGGKRYVFGTEQSNIRGKDFEFVTMNGQPAGFTTEVGKNWEMWMAYRELYCNAKDEGGKVEKIEREPDSVEANADRTEIIVQGYGIAEIFDQHDEFFLDDEPLHKGQWADAHRGRASNAVFYKGIRAYELNLPSMYTYNITNTETLTEDRTIANWHNGVATNIAELTMSSNDEEFIANCALAAPFHFESQFDYSSAASHASNTFIEVIRRLRRNRLTDINESMNRIYENATKKHEPSTPTPLELDEVQKKQLARAKEFLVKAGYPVDRYTIRCVETLGQRRTVLGSASGLGDPNGVITLTRAAFEAGTKTVAGTLLEEHLHLSEGLPDESRRMQNWLVDHMITLNERLLGEPI